MEEHPILFSKAMVCALLEGRKTQTRRVMSFQPEPHTEVHGPELYAPVVVKCGEEEPGTEIFGVYGDDWGLKCPYGQPGDRLWVREKWRCEELESGLDGVRFSGDNTFRKIENTIETSHSLGEHNNNRTLWINNKWRPSIFMPRWACRIELEIVSVRAERVREITRNDAIAEGVSGVWKNPPEKEEYYQRVLLNPYVANYSVLWDEINASRGFGWDVNPWVWVIEFRRV
jgi:hypothetical protein